MDWMIWAAVAAVLVLAAAATPFFAPARTIILIDTGTSTARAEMRPLWGLGPIMYKRWLPQETVGGPLAAFGDAGRAGSALMTPGIADATYHALHRVFALKPKVAQLEVRWNLGDPTQNLVVQTGAQAVLAVAPASIRNCVVIGKRDAPGAELSAKFELTASPAEISAIYNELKGSRAGQEFRRRLKRAPKAAKRPVREVRAS